LFVYLVTVEGATISEVPLIRPPVTSSAPPRTLPAPLTTLPTDSLATPRVFEASDAALPTILPVPPIAALPIFREESRAESTVLQPVNEKAAKTAIYSDVLFILLFIFFY